MHVLRAAGTFSGGPLPDRLPEMVGRSEPRVEDLSHLLVNPQSPKTAPEALALFISVRDHANSHTGDEIDLRQIDQNYRICAGDEFVLGYAVKPAFLSNTITLDT